MSKRWPGWVYDHGTEPDPRFSFANERTFLAWLRTALAIVAGAVALNAFKVPQHTVARVVVVLLLLILALLCAGASWLRWARAERAMRLDLPLPSSPLTPILTAGTALVVVVLMVFVW